jgi:acyl-CoA synthetase (NDP forming)
LALTRDQYGDQLAILTNSGGAGVLAADALVAAGDRLAELSRETLAELDRLRPATSSRGNPVDIGDASDRRYADTLPALIRDTEADAALVLNCPTALAQPEEAARATIDTIAAGASRNIARPQCDYRLARRALRESGAAALRRSSYRHLRNSGQRGRLFSAPERATGATRRC